MRLLKIFSLLIISLITFSIVSCNLASTNEDLIEVHRDNLQTKKWELSETYCDGILNQNITYLSYEFSENEVVITSEETINGDLVRVAVTETYFINLYTYDGKFTLTIDNDDLTVVALGDDQLTIRTDNNFGSCFFIFE